MTRLLTNLRSSMRTLLCASLFLWMSIPANAQRFTDNLDRGLVAVNMGGSTFLSWRILAQEYFGVTYNVYRDGVKIAEGLTVSNYTDSGTGTNYTVSVVVDGVEKAQSASVSSLWPVSDKGNQVDKYLSGRIDLTLATVYDRNGNDVTANYSPNDAEFADLDGDGQLEMIIKRLNTVDAANVYPQSNTTEFVVLDAYDINWQTGTATLMWRIDCGPNMVSLNSTEINIIAYDWDGDGNAEVVLRGADNMIVYDNTGKNRLYTIGDMTVNTRNTFDPANGAQYAWTHTGNEYLLYLNGQTGALYQQMDYPLKRLEYALTLSDEWGGRGYGHNSSKYFFGAPYFDGRTPSLFMARGIYGTHKMIAMDLNGHTWSERWSWNCRDTSSPWYGQGYHNFVVADVDEDGRDEIVYGSMVIDDNGKGLHTTGYGHGDAQHVSDFDPYRKGLEFFGCLEDEPTWGCNYRDATTGEVLYKFTSSGDDGRCMMDNISNSYPGSLGHSSASQTISSVTRGEVSEAGSIFYFKDTNISLNFRIYWDGDLLSELLDSPGTMGQPMIYKPEVGRLLTGVVGNMNNDSKNNPCFQGDIIGDWREEIVVRNGSNAVSIYTSVIPSENPIPCLWFDHQYRQAMVWQMMAYNQPPHVSYFLGELEGYTTAPPPSTMAGRLEVSGGIGSVYDDQQIILCEPRNTTVSVDDGTAPYVFFDNAPTLVQGHDNNNNITTETYTHTLTGGAFTGGMRLVKQGNGKLVLPSVTETYTGNTDVWAGTLQFDGTMQNSPVWMNRHTTLNTTGGTFGGGLTMEYGATLNVGGAQVGNCKSVNISELSLNYGACVVLDVNGTGDAEHDWLNATTLNIDDSKVGVDAWENYGPENIVPVFKLNMTGVLDNGRYPIGNVTTVNGDLSKVKIECDAIDARYLSLIQDDGILYLQVSDVAIANEARIEITGMAPYETVSTLYPSASSDNYYLPVVSIVANNTDGQVPTLSGTFTSLGGRTVTNIGSNEEVILFSEDYEHATEVSGWTHSGAPMSIGSEDATHGRYFLIDLGSTSTRYAYKRISSVDVSNGCGYSIEFDLALKAGNTDPGEFCVMSKGGTNPTNYWDNYASINNNANLLFDLAGSKNSTVYNVNGTTTTTTLASETWYHITLNVNQGARTVAWQISNGSSGTFTLPPGTSTEFDGFYFVTGRYNSKAMFDNIVIKSSGTDMSSYTFTEPGTLQVTSDVEGYASGIKTFEVKYPYYKLYESPDFSTLAAADATTMLGSSYWNNSTYSNRWANWNSNNNYTMVSAIRANKMYVDSKKVLWANIKEGHPGNRLLTLIEGYGIGQTTYSGDSDGNSGTVFHATELGDENTIIYHKYDLSRGYTPKTYIEEYIHADENGNYDYDSGNNFTLQKFIAYVPVAIHDEQATVLPQALDASGNAHVWRNGLTNTSTWATMVVPFDMTAAQVREVFGDGVTVANLETGKGNGSQIYFETIDVATASEATIAITANKPCLMKGVTKNAPYLIMGISTEPAEEPSVSNGHFTFVGTYTYLGQKAFTTNDYFFTTSGLSRVETNGTKMSLKGYRGYFQGLTANGAKNIKTVFEESDVVTGILDVPTIMRNDVYDLQGRKIPENWQRKKGVYIVNGRKMIVK